MAKILLSEVLTSESAAGSFLAADGLLNFDAIGKVQEKIAAILKTDKEGALKVTGTYVIPRRAKPTKYSASLEKKRDHKYLLQRATKVAKRVRLKPEALARVAVLLQVVEGLPKALAENVKKIEADIVRHMNKMAKVTDKVKTEKGKIREVANKQFDESLEIAQDIMLGNAQVEDKDIVIAQGMMGKTMLIRLDKEHVISITKSDIARFNAARKAAKEAAAQ